MDLMRHGDYVARITYDEEIGSFFGEVQELRREMATSIEVLIEACRAKGVEPSRLYGISQEG